MREKHEIRCKYGKLSLCVSAIIDKLIPYVHQALCQPVAQCTRLHTIAHTCVYINIYLCFVPLSLSRSLLPFSLPSPSSLFLLFFPFTLSLLHLSPHVCVAVCIVAYLYILHFEYVKSSMYFTGYTLLAAFLYSSLTLESWLHSMPALNLLILSGV